MVPALLLVLGMALILVFYSNSQTPHFSWQAALVIGEVVAAIGFVLMVVSIRKSRSRCISIP
jgi:hypothetical protein